MLKKTSIQSLLDSLPEEIDDDQFFSAVDELSRGEIPAWQKEAVIAEARKARKEGAMSLEACETEMDAWSLES